MSTFLLSNYGLFPEKGGVKVKYKTIDLNDWKIINIPEYEDFEYVRQYVKRFIDRIVAVETPSSLQCNLRCEYCYIRNPMYKSINVQTSSIEKILDAVFTTLPRYKDKNTRELFFTPWGAEPLMNLDTLELIVDYLIKKHKEGYNVKTHFSTNATIWNNRIENILLKAFKNKIIESIQISLDGPPEIQNKYRPHVNRNLQNFELVKEFTIHLQSMLKNVDKIKGRGVHFSSTIYVDADDFEESLLKIYDFFTTPHKWFTSIPYLPARIAWEQFTEKTVKRFVNANIKATNLLYTKFKKFGIRAIDFYTAKFFFSSFRNRNGFYYCSALNSQVGIDIDGSIYPCHGPITSPEQKSMMRIGNLFEKTIDYTGLIRMSEAMWANHSFKGKCKTCPVYKYAPGSIAFTCPTHSLLYSTNEYDDNIFKCISMINLLPYFVSLAEVMSGQKFTNIPDEYRAQLHVLDDYDFLYENDVIEMAPIDTTKVRVDTFKFNGFMYNSLQNLLMMPFNKAYEITSKDYYDEWWIFDDFFDKAKKGE